MRGRRGQTAMEFLIIVIIVLMFLTPMWIYLAQVRGQTNDQFHLSYAKNVVTKLAKTSDLVHSQSMGAKVKMSIFMPSSVQSMNISGTTIMMNVLTNSGPIDVWDSTIGNVNGTLPINEGLYWVLVESKGSYVQIGMIE